MRFARKPMGWSRRFQVVAVVGATVATASGAPKRNVILLISDGQGFNAMLATEYYAGSPAVYRDFGVRLGMTNFPFGGSFDPEAMWASFDYPRTNPTDSAAAASAMYAGQKTANGRILYDAPGGVPMVSLAEIADARALATGVVSSVQFSHATPAAVAAHNVSRNNYVEIANEMVYESGLDVIMGCGNPDFDNDGYFANDPDYRYVGGPETWSDIKAGTANGFEFVDSPGKFQALADGSYNGGDLPDKLLACPRVHDTLQLMRSGDDEAEPYQVPFTPSVPTLETMTRGALNVLAQNENGLFLMVEGGAVDWAGHGNVLGRQIEEQTDFNDAVRAVVEWVEACSSWEETLVIVTADHETGHLWGAPGSYEPLTDNGPGEMPGHAWNSGSHTNQLVPLFAEGADSALLLERVVGTDVTGGAFYGYSGDYVDNADLFPAMKTRIVGSCWSDVDGNALVGFADLSALLAKWGARGGLEDVNADGVVDFLDLVRLLSDWGPCPG